jgi:Transposase protein
MEAQPLRKCLQINVPFLGKWAFSAESILGTGQPRLAAEGPRGAPPAGFAGARAGAVRGYESSPAEANPQAQAAFEEQKAKLLEQVEHRQHQLEKLKAERKAIERKLTLKELPEADRFTQLRTAKKHFVDTLKLIAYRAETALLHLVREKLPRADDGQALVRQVFNSAVDLCPDHQKKTLTVRVHPLTTVAHSQGRFDQPYPGGGNLLTVYPAQDGSLWVGGVGETVLARIAPGGEVLRFTSAQGFNAQGVGAICEDSKSNPWVGSYSGLCCVRDGQAQVVKVPS